MHISTATYKDDLILVLGTGLKHVNILYNFDITSFISAQLKYLYHIFASSSHLKVRSFKNQRLCIGSFMVEHSGKLSVLFVTYEQLRYFRAFALTRSAACSGTRARA
jgi:hypothetical protein